MVVENHPVHTSLKSKQVLYEFDYVFYSNFANYIALKHEPVKKCPNKVSKIQEDIPST